MKEIKKVGVNNSGEIMKIIEYKDSRHILVEFENGYKKWGTYGNFLKGVMKNDTHPTVYGVGYLNIKGGSSKYPKEYIFWQSMIRRCYATEWKNKHKVYFDATCSDDWLYFSKFIEWAHSQKNWDVVISSNTRFELDKDIIKKHNKHYCPELCCFVPHYLNKLFTKHDVARGEYPIGVTYNKKSKCFESSYSDKGEKYISKLGFKDAESAFKQYKTDKENLIKHLASEEYEKGNITEICFNAMMRYEVEITD